WRGLLHRARCASAGSWLGLQRPNRSGEGRRHQRGVVAVDAAGPGFSRRHSQTSTGHTNAPIAIEARIAEIGRSKNGRMLPSDLISDVTKACSTIVPITM